MKKLTILIFIGLLAICGCSKKEENTEIENSSKSIIATDFVTYDIARNIAKDSGYEIELIDVDEELSGRDKNKINKSSIFIDTKNTQDTDENKTINIFDYIEIKENNKDDNKIYSNITLNIEEEKEEISEEAISQVVVIPNSESKKETEGTQEEPKETKKEAEGTQGEAQEEQAQNNTGEIYLTDKVKLTFKKSTFNNPPSSADKNGYSLGNYPQGYKVRTTNDEYSEWLCNRMMSLECRYVGIDNGNGTYTLFMDDTALTPQFKVISPEDIIITDTFGVPDVVFEDTLQKYFTKADIKILANTVDVSTDYWLDVNNAIKISSALKDKLIEIDPENKDIYDKNHKDYNNELETLNNKIKYIVENSENQTIFIGGEFNYKYFTDAYGINYISLYDYSTEELPTLTRLSNFANILNNYKIKYVIKDKESSMEGINSIKTELDYNLNTVIIDSIQTAETDDSYINIMNDNYIILKKAIY